MGQSHFGVVCQPEAQSILRSRGEEGIQFNSNILWNNTSVSVKMASKESGFYKRTVILNIPPKLRQTKLRQCSLSPDLNIIENLQTDLQTERAECARRPRNPTELEDFHKEEQAKIL